MALVNASRTFGYSVRKKKDSAEEKEEKIIWGKNQNNLCQWAVFTCLMMLCFVQIVGNTLGNETTYCEVLLDGEVIGAVAARPLWIRHFWMPERGLAGKWMAWYLAMWSAVFRQVSAPLWDDAESSQNWKL